MCRKFCVKFKHINKYLNKQFSFIQMWQMYEYLANLQPSHTVVKPYNLADAPDQIGKSAVSSVMTDSFLHAGSQDSDQTGQMQRLV